MKEKILVLVYPGLGKTYTAENFANVIDFEQQFYTYIYDDSVKHLPLEQIKSDASKKTPNPEWPDNFIKGIDGALENNEIVITTFTPKVYDALCVGTHRENTRTILVFFDRDNFDELADRYRARGNTEEFIDRRKVDFQKVMQRFDDDETAEKVVVKAGGGLFVRCVNIARHQIDPRRRQKELFLMC